MDTPRLDQLMREVETRLAAMGHGGKVTLAREIGASKQAVQGWVDGRSKPNGELTLALIEWLRRPEVKKEAVAEKSHKKNGRLH